MLKLKCSINHFIVGDFFLKKVVEKFKQAPMSAWILSLALISCGLFYEVMSAIFSVVLITVIIVCILRQKFFKIRLNLLSLSVGAIVLFYALSVFWAVDRGMAVFGAVKFLPLLLFLVLLMQGKEEGLSSLCLVPDVAAFMTVISALLMQIPALSLYFSVNGRLSGFLGYPNTFALLLLCSLIYTLLKDKLFLPDFIYIGIFIFGIFYSGSRTVFILTVISVILIVFKKIKSIKVKIAVSLGVITLISAVAVISAVGGFTNTVGRFLTLSFKSSTFLGRLLYFYDALPVIAKNPLGLGFLGYYSLEQSIQTGVYSVRYLHNDFLQLLLDIGWLPTLTFIFTIFKTFIKKGTDFKTRMLIFVIVAHSLFDFSLQFVGIFMMFIALLYKREGREITLKKSGIVTALLGVMAAFSVYMALPLGFYLLGDYGMALSIYPAYTEAKTGLLTRTEDVTQMNALADSIIISNKYNSVAHSAKANYYFALGDVENAVFQMELAIEKAPFSYEEYEKTVYILQNAISIYEQAGEEESIRFCKEKLIKTADKLHSLEDRLSPLGKKIVDQPTLTFPEETERYIEEIKNEK